MFLKTAQAAERLGVSTRQVRRLIAEGRLREVARGILLETDVTAFVAAHSGPGRRRTWNAVTAWAAIDIVTGGAGSMVEPTQRSRLRGRIRQLTVEGFVTSTVNRVRTMTFDTGMPDLSDASGWVVPLQPHGQHETPRTQRLDAYIAPSRLDRLVERLQLVPDFHGHGRVTLRITDADYGLLRVLTSRGAFLAAVEHASSPDPARRADALRRVASGLAAYRARDGGSSTATPELKQSRMERR